MNRETAINAIKRKIGKSGIYKTRTDAAAAIGMSYVHFNRVLNTECTIPQSMLDIAGLEVTQPPATYKYRGR